MALPTMRGYWSSRKNMYEQAIVKQRNHEDDFRSQWSETDKYFKTSDVRAAKQQAWSSTGAYQDKCSDAYKASVEKDVKAANLKRRQDKLSHIIMEETKAYQAELRGMSKDNYDRLEDMKSRADGLRSAREDKRKKMAEEKLYEHWRQNNPELRKAEKEILQEHVVSEWGDQKQEKLERLQSARRENEEMDREMEHERLAALDLERQKAEERLREEKSVKEVLREQMMEFKARETEAAVWKKQQDELIRQKWEIGKIEDMQRFREEERKKKDLGRMLLRQHKAQMMRKSKVIQEELEQDRKLLESLIEKENEHTALQSARREKARADAHWMKQVLDEQLRVEKAREAELDMLYQDEAARQWQKRDSEWEKERQARQRLMSEVLESRQEQIGDKLEELRQQQEESLKRREELVAEMEIAQQMTRREEEDKEKEKLMTRAQLEEQIYSKREEAARLQRQLDLDLDNEQREEKDYEDLLKEETQRMRIQGHTHRDFGRKQAWM